MNTTHGTVSWIVLLVFLSSSAVASASAGAAWVNVQDYFPDHWQDEEQLDLREHIQQALNENPRVYFPGGNDANTPLRYHTTTGLVVPAHHQVDFGPHHRLVRLPSEGHMIELQDRARLSGAIIDGNKYNHWPEFEDLGKNDSAVQIHNHCVVEDVVVYNTPGIAFYTVRPIYLPCSILFVAGLATAAQGATVSYWQLDESRHVADRFRQIHHASGRAFCQVLEYRKSFYGTGL